MEDSSNPSPKKNDGSWLLWWRIDKSVIENQVNKYAVLGLFESYRKRSALLVFASAIVTLYLSELSDIGIFLSIVIVLWGVFIYRGSKIALLLIMIFTTIERLVQLIDGHVILAISLWILYMGQFYYAFKIESVRSLARKNEITQLKKENSLPYKSRKIKTGLIVFVLLFLLLGVVGVYAYPLYIRKLCLDRLGNIHGVRFTEINLDYRKCLIDRYVKPVDLVNFTQ